MVDEHGIVKCDSALMLDGRLIGIYSAYADYNRMSDLLYSATLRRLMNYMFFGLDERQAEDFERDLYDKLWYFYSDNFLEELGFYLQFSNIKNIDDMIPAWKQAIENGFTNREFWETNKEAYETFFEETVLQYYIETNMPNETLSRNIHLFAHVENQLYIDFLDWDEAGYAREYNFINDTDLFILLDMNSSNNFADHPPISVCGMAQWRMKNSFYDFLYDTQCAVKSKPAGFLWNIDNLPVYLWEIDPIEWGNGLEVNHLGTTGLSEEELAELMERLNQLLNM